MPYAGGCSCGAVHYELTAEPIRGFQCQCRDCQRDTGSGHASVMVFPRAAMRVSGPMELGFINALTEKAIAGRAPFMEDDWRTENWSDQDRHGKDHARACRALFVGRLHAPVPAASRRGCNGRRQNPA